ncbi:Sialidase, partial [Apiosordaria backusii]
SSPVLIAPSSVYPRANALFNLSSPHPDTPLIITSYTTLSGPNKILSLSISTDHAQSWTFLSHIWQANASTHDIDNPFPLQLPNGDILYAFRNHDIDPVTSGEYTYYRITICISKDYGQTWEFLSHASERKANREKGKNNGLWEPFLRVDGKGRLQVYYSGEKEGDGKRQDNVMRVSDDLGRTWNEERVVSRGRDGKEARDGMMGVAEAGDGEEGHLVCIFETTEDDGVFSVDTVESFDDGESWGEGTRKRVYTAADGRDAGAPQVWNVGGVLVGSFMTNEGSGTEQIDGGEMKIILSRDGGKTWSNFGKDGESTATGQRATVAAEKGSHWPGLFKLDDKRFLALYSADGMGAVSRVFEI